MLDMHVVYSHANGNSLEANRLYAEMYLKQLKRHNPIFARFHQCLSDSRIIQKPTTLCYHSIAIKMMTLKQEQEVLNTIYFWKLSKR